MIHEVMNLKVILLVSSEFSLNHFYHLQPLPVSALHESSKKLLFGLSLNIGQDKNVNLHFSLE